MPKIKLCTPSYHKLFKLHDPAQLVRHQIGKARNLLKGTRRLALV